MTESRRIELSVGVIIAGIMLSLYLDSVVPLVLYIAGMVWMAQKDIQAAWRRLWH